MIEVLARTGDFHAAGGSLPTEEALGGGIVNPQAVNDEPVVVETGYRGRDGGRPVPLVVALHVDVTRTQASASGVELHLGRPRSIQPEADPAVRVHARVLLVRKICGGGFRIIRGLREGQTTEEKGKCKC